MELHLEKFKLPSHVTEIIKNNSKGDYSLRQ